MSNQSWSSNLYCLFEFDGLSIDTVRNFEIVGKDTALDIHGNLGWIVEQEPALIYPSIIILGSVSENR